MNSDSVQKVQLEVAARSETGYVREENQDRMIGAQVPLGQLYIVADGMGGHKGGAVAAELTVQGLQQDIGEARENGSVEEVIQAAFKKTNETVYQKAHSGDQATEGMGSTAVLLLISGEVARVAHVGDSRAYLYRNGQLRQLTTDHTLVQKMVQAGMLKPEEARDHPNASVLERAIGNKPSVEVDISDKLQLSEGDAILLCSDGLSGYIADPEIEAVLRSQETVQEIPEHLVKLALQKGGEDNVTVQFIQYGTRKEAQPRRTKKLEKLPLMSTMQVRRPSVQMAAAFVLGVAIIAFGYYKSWPVDKLDRRGALSKPQGGALASAKPETKEDVKKLQEDVKKLQEDVKKLQEDVQNLQAELGPAKTAKEEAKGDPRRQRETQEPVDTGKKVENSGQKSPNDARANGVVQTKAGNNAKQRPKERKANRATSTEAEGDERALNDKSAAAVQETPERKKEREAADAQPESPAAASAETPKVEAQGEATKPDNPHESQPAVSAETTSAKTTEELGNTETPTGTDSTNP